MVTRTDPAAEPTTGPTTGPTAGPTAGPDTEPVPGRASGTAGAPATAAVFAGPLRRVTVGLLLTVSLIAFEAISVATALPTAVRALDGMAFYGWPFSAFLVVSVLGMVVGGELSDRRGPARPILIGLVAFVLGLLASGTAVAMAPFVLGRAIQGFGVGLLVVAIYVVVASVYDERLRPRMFGLLSAAWVLPSLLGPVVAGALTQHASWRLVFLTVPPLVVAATVLILPALRHTRTPRSDPAGGRRRWPFALLAGVGIVALQHAADRFDVLSLAFAAVGVGALVPAVRVLLPRGTVRARRGLPAVVALRGLSAGAFFAVDALVPLTLTVVHGFGPTAAALPLTLGALGWSSASWWQGHHPDARRHLLIAVGMTGIATAGLLMAVVSQPWSPGWLAYGAWMVGGAGMGLVMPSVSLLTISLSPVAERGRNSAALQIGDVLTSAVCIGFGGALVAAAERGTFPLAGAVAAVDLTMVAVALLGVSIARRVRRPG